jgi:hypothetical protein
MSILGRLRDLIEGIGEILYDHLERFAIKLNEFLFQQSG